MYYWDRFMVQKLPYQAIQAMMLWIIKKKKSEGLFGRL